MKAEHVKDEMQKMESAMQKMKLEKDGLMIEIADINKAIIENVAFKTKIDNLKKELHAA